MRQGRRRRKARPAHPRPKGAVARANLRSHTTRPRRKRAAPVTREALAGRHVAECKPDRRTQVCPLPAPSRRIPASRTPQGAFSPPPAGMPPSDPACAPPGLRQSAASAAAAAVMSLATVGHPSLARRQGSASPTQLQRRNPAQRLDAGNSSCLTRRRQEQPVATQALLMSCNTIKKSIFRYMESSRVMNF